MLGLSRDFGPKEVKTQPRNLVHSLDTKVDGDGKTVPLGSLRKGVTSGQSQINDHGLSSIHVYVIGDST